MELLVVLRHSRNACQNPEGPQAVPRSRHLNFIAIDVLEPLPKTAHSNQHVLLFANRLSKQTRGILLHTTASLVVASEFQDHRVDVYGAPRYASIDYGPQFAAVLFNELCALCARGINAMQLTIPIRMGIPNILIAR